MAENTVEKTDKEKAANLLPGSKVYEFWKRATKGQGWRIGSILGCGAALGAIGGFFLPKALQNIVSTAQTTFSGGNILEPATVLALAAPVVGFYVAETLLYSLKDSSKQVMDADMKKERHDSLFKHTTSLDHSYFETRQRGAIYGKIGQSVGGAAAIDGMAIGRIPQLAFYSASAAVAVATVSWPLFLTIAASSAALGGVGFYSNMVTSKNRNLMNDQRANISANGVDVLTNIQTVRSSGQIDNEQKRMSDMSEQYRQQSYTLVKKNLPFHVTQMISWDVMGGVIAVAGLYIANQSQDLGQYTLVGMVGHGMANVARGLMDCTKDIHKNHSELRHNLTELLQEQTVPELEGSERLNVSERNGTIEFHGVCFKHGQTKVFDNLNLTIDSGEKVAVIGSSGAGKSTLANLIMRTYDPEYGYITIDGQNLSEVRKDSIPAAVGFMPQKPDVFTRTIGENIAYGCDDATPGDIEAAARKAQIHGYIKGLEKGYDTLVGEKGVNLSGGQMQRLAIARALCRDPKILVFDEPTSALDKSTEQEILGAIERLSKDRTVVIISHNMAMVEKV
ncbi:MAG: ABC transporter ATP-binding protein/permease, partial [Alphaproteobacteria bacterium]|nr:ABC transporter ATP-binding protein/permease [Alphaproteobacteria bacterium]